MPIKRPKVSRRSSIIIIDGKRVPLVFEGETKPKVFTVADINPLALVDNEKAEKIRTARHALRELRDTQS